MGALASSGWLSRLGGQCVKWNGLHSLQRSSHLGPCRQVFNSFPDTNTDTNADAYANTDADTNSNTNTHTNGWRYGVGRGFDTSRRDIRVDWQWLELDCRESNAV